MSVVDILDSALSIAAAGFPIFPCGRDKRPICQGGFKAATTDPAQICTLFARPAAALIGMPTGAASGVVAIDIDPRHGGDKWFEAHQDKLPETRIHETMNKGVHLVFKMPAAELRNSAGKIAPGVDVRGDGGYIIIPPSIGYSVWVEAEPAEMPAWLEALCRPAPAPASSSVPQPFPARTASPEAPGTPYGIAALNGECNVVANANPGTQENTLNAAALKIGALIAGGELSEAAAQDLIAAGCSMPSQAGKRPWTRAEVERKVMRAIRDGKTAPRTVGPFFADQEAPDLSNIAPYIAKIKNANAALQKMAKDATKNQQEPQVQIPEGVYEVDGLLKEILDDCIARAYRPQPFLALAAAISAVAVAAGRRYCTTTNLRPNVYLIAVANSGAGKDAPLDYVRSALSAADLVDYLGGEEIASGSGIITALSDHPVRLFCLDEMGLMLQAITGKKAAPYKAEIMALFMKFFSRANSIFYGKQYANAKECPRIDIQQPHVAVFGATTPSTLWAALEGGALVDGSVARFLVFASDQSSVPRNKNMPAGDFPNSILDGLKSISNGVAGHDYGGNLSDAMISTTRMEPFKVPYTPDGYLAMETYFDRQEAWLAKINHNQSEVTRPGEAEIVARIGEHASKLAMISAIGRSPQAPVIETRDVQWATLLTDHCANTLLSQSSIYIADNEYEKKLSKAFDLVVRFGPITERDLIRRGLKLPERERQELLNTLIAGGLITATKSTPGVEGGRTTVRYSAPPHAGEETNQIAA
jgi:hypothetical protein